MTTSFFAALNRTDLELVVCSEGSQSIKLISASHENAALSFSVGGDKRF